MSKAGEVGKLTLSAIEGASTELVFSGAESQYQALFLLKQRKSKLPTTTEYEPFIQD